MSDAEKPNPFEPPSALGSTQTPSDSPSVLIQAISALSTLSLFSLLAMVPCGILAQMGFFPLWAWLVPTFFFFVPLIFAAVLVVVFVVVETLKRFFVTEESTDEW